MSDSEFHVATSSLYDFFLNEFCDVYLEYAKLYISGEVLRVRGCACFASCAVFSPLTTKPSPLQPRPRQAQIKNVLNTCLESYFRLLHPFMPYVSEELWQRLPTSHGQEVRIFCYLIITITITIIFILIIFDLLIIFIFIFPLVRRKRIV